MYPVYLVQRVLHHARACGCKGTLVVPEWPSAVFWPLLCNTGYGFRDFVRESMYLPLSTELIVRGKAGANLFKDGNPQYQCVGITHRFFLAVRL